MDLLNDSHDFLKLLMLLSMKSHVAFHEVSYEICETRGISPSIFRDVADERREVAMFTRQPPRGYSLKNAVEQTLLISISHKDRKVFPYRSTRQTPHIAIQTAFGEATIPQQNRKDAIHCVRTNYRNLSFTIAVNCDRESHTGNHAITCVGLVLLASSG